MIVDLMRASNDHGELGFVSQSRHLNVLLSRQNQALVIVGDKDRIKPIVMGKKDVDARVARQRNYENRKILEMFAWMQKNGRLVDVPLKLSVAGLCQVQIDTNPSPRPLIRVFSWNSAPVSAADASGRNDSSPAFNYQWWLDLIVWSIL